MHLPKAIVDPERNGIFAALGAFTVWGVLPIFWKALGHVNSVEVLFQRMFWSFVVLMLFMPLTGRLGPALGIFRRPREIGALALSGALLGFNWYLYIWAIANNMVVEAGLGYFITPILNILTGMLFFRERPGRLGRTAIFLAAGGVLFRLITLGGLPLVALGLSVSFAAYGLLRKIVVVEALPGLFAETALMLPVALAWLVHEGLTGSGSFARTDLWTNCLLIATGIITTLPLFWFSYGTRRIRMSTLGLAQYLTPSMIFLLGVFVYDEPVTPGRMVTFICIWTALALYTWENLRGLRRLPPQTVTAAAGSRSGE